MVYKSAEKVIESSAEAAFLSGESDCNSPQFLVPYALWISGLRYQFPREIWD